MRMSRLAFFASMAVLFTLAAPASAGDVTLFAGGWDTDAAGDAGGGGLRLGWSMTPRTDFELRASYYEELTDDPLGNAFDSDATVFEDQGIQVTPIEIGLRFHLGSGSTFRPFLGGGASYFLLDSDFGEINDELGYYATIGAEIGDGRGADFVIEGLWRKASARIDVDPERLDDIDDLEVQDHANFDIDGLGVNLGVIWRF